MNQTYGQNVNNIWCDFKFVSKMSAWASHLTANCQLLMKQFSSAPEYVTSAIEHSCFSHVCGGHGVAKYDLSFLGVKHIWQISRSRVHIPPHTWYFHQIPTFVDAGFNTGCMGFIRCHNYNLSLTPTMTALTLSKLRRGFPNFRGGGTPRRCKTKGIITP